MIKSLSTNASPLMGMLSVLTGLVSGCLLALIMTANFTLDRVAESSARREQQQLLQAISGLAEELRKQIGTVTNWDQAVQHSVVNPDPRWLHQHVGARLMSDYGVDEVHIVDHRGKPIYVGRAGKMETHHQWSGEEPQSTPLLRAAHAQLTALDAAGRGNPVPAEDGQDAMDFALLDGQPVLMIADAIVQDTKRVTTAAAGTAALIAIKHMDAEWLSTIASRLMIAQPGFQSDIRDGQAEANQMTRLALKGRAGETVGILQWPAWQPLQAFSRSVKIPTMTALVVMLVGSFVVAMLVRRSRREFVTAHHAALHDELTGLPNRRQMNQILGTMIDGKVVAMFIDLDRFKEINDIWGHEAGDEILTVMASRLQGLTDNAHFARFGGDEFVMLLVDVELGDAEDMAMAVLALLRKPHAVNGAQVSLGGSIGIAHNFDGAISDHELLRRADLALYEAKARGRNCFVTFQPAMDASLQNRRRLEDALARAIAEKRIEVVYQPIIDGKSGKMVAVESLARWHDAVLGNISPAEFVPVAEEVGLVQDLGRLVLQRACMDAARWPGIRISVNVSPAQMRVPGLVDEVGLVLQQAAIAPERLTLEITENALMADRELAMRMLSQLHRMGIRMALDDFGTGHSSLAYLRDFQFDFLKIDHHFVDGLARGEYDVLVSIIALGHALKLDVVAEGIETREQYNLLRTAGCDGFQGYYFGKPMSAASIDALLRASGNQKLMDEAVPMTTRLPD